MLRNPKRPAPATRHNLPTTDPNAVRQEISPLRTLTDATRTKELKLEFEKARVEGK